MVDATPPSGSEFKLDEIRNRLELIFDSLATIHSGLVIACEYLHSKSPNHRSGIADVLMKLAVTPFGDELKELTDIIESLGGSVVQPDDGME